GAYALALRLERGAATPFAYVRAVEGYLARGFTYNESPAPAAYPLETFLLRTRAGYCQQFAGAMALLLRMGGVPARVSVGFTSGSYDTATRRWLVSDLDAHAWVEAGFPRYGWVRFDPTPAAAPARGRPSPISGARGHVTGARAPPPRLARGRRVRPGTPARPVRRRHPPALAAAAPRAQGAPAKRPRTAGPPAGAVGAASTSIPPPKLHHQWMTCTTSSRAVPSCSRRGTTIRR